MQIAVATIGELMKTSQFFVHRVLARAATLALLALALFAAGCAEDSAGTGKASEGDGKAQTFGAADPTKPWVNLPGKAFDVATGSTDNSVWILGAELVPGTNAHPVKHWQNGSFVPGPYGGYGIGIAVYPDNSGLIVIGSNHEIYWGGITGGWWQMPGWALDCAIGNNGSIWVVGLDHALYTWTGSTWKYVNGYADRIAVQPWGLPVVTNQWGIYELTDAGTGAWKPYGGTAYDVSVGSEGTLAIVGTNIAGGGFGIFNWTNFGWIQPTQAGYTGGGVKIAVDMYGRAVVVNDAGDVYLQGDTPIPTPGGIYSFFNQGSGKCLGVAGNSTTNGASIVQWDCVGAANQYFKAVPAGSGTFNFVNVNSGKVIDIAGGPYYTGNGVGLEQWDSWGGDNEKFRVISQTGGFFALVAVHSNKCLGIDSGSTANGAVALQWDCLGVAGQTWKLQRKASSGQIVGVKLGGAAMSCNYEETIPGVYDITCGNLLSLKGLSGVINSATSFSLDGTVGNLKGAVPGVAPLVNFVDSQILTGLDSANIHMDGPEQGAKIRITATVGFGAGFTPLLETINNTFGVNLAVLKPYVTIDLKEGEVEIDALIYNGPRAEKEVPDIGTAFALNSLNLRFKSAEGAKALKVRAVGEIRVTSADNWVPTVIEIERTNENGETIVANAQITGWKKPLGFVPVDVNKASFTAGFINRVLSAYRITIDEAVAYSSSGQAYYLAGEYAADRPNKKFYFGLNTPQMPLLIGVEMLAGADATLKQTLATLKLDTLVLQAYNGKNVTVAFSPTGGPILGKDYEQKSYLYGQLNVQGPTGGTVPANVDATAVITYDAASKKYKVGDFDAKVSLDLASLLAAIKQSSGVDVGILNVLGLKALAINVARVGNVISGGASATLRICGMDKSLAFDTSNIPKFISDAVNLIGSLVSQCNANAVCPAGYVKVGALCDKPCPDFFKASPGLCTHITGQCWNPTVGYIFPNCKNPGTCAQYSYPADGALGKNDLCVYACSNWPGMSGAFPSCINNDSGKPMVYPK